MSKKPRTEFSNKYHEDQLLFILMSYRFRVDRIQKIIANPIFEAPTQVQKVRTELIEILRQLKSLGWYVPHFQN